MGIGWTMFGARSLAPGGVPHLPNWDLGIPAGLEGISRQSPVHHRSEFDENTLAGALLSRLVDSFFLSIWYRSEGVWSPTG